MTEVWCCYQLVRLLSLWLLLLAEERDEVASSCMASEIQPPSDTTTQLEQWDLVTHDSGQDQDKHEKLANVVYNEIKGPSYHVESKTD